MTEKNKKSLNLCGVNVPFRDYFGSTYKNCLYFIGDNNFSFEIIHYQDNNYFSIKISFFDKKILKYGQDFNLMKEKVEDEFFTFMYLINKTSKWAESYHNAKLLK